MRFSWQEYWSGFSASSKDTICILIVIYITNGIPRLSSETLEWNLKVVAKGTLNKKFFLGGGEVGQLQFFPPGKRGRGIPTSLHASRCGDFSFCNHRPKSTGSIIVVRVLNWSLHVGSSWIRDRTHASCIGRWILYHWTTREAPDDKNNF